MAFAKRLIRRCPPRPKTEPAPHPPIAARWAPPSPRSRGEGRRHRRAPSPRLRGEGWGEGPPASRGDELVPFADHVAVFVHHRVPHADMAHPLVERAAVAHRAGAFDLLAG